MCFYLHSFNALNFYHNKLRKRALTNHIYMLQYGMTACDCRYIGYVEDDKDFILPKNKIFLESRHQAMRNINST